MSRDIRETLVRSSHDGIAIICHVRLRQDVLANVARPSYDRRTTVARLSFEGRANVARWLCEKMITREHIKFLQCFNHQSSIRWSLIKTKLICSELQHVYLLQLLLRRRKLRQGRYDKEEKGRVYG